MPSATAGQDVVGQGVGMEPRPCGPGVGDGDATIEPGCGCCVRWLAADAFEIGWMEAGGPSQSQ